MKVITKEELLKLSKPERCRILVDIVNGKVIYKESEENERDNKRNEEEIVQ